MRLYVLGMNGPYPASNGATSGYLLESEENIYQLDMGTGTLGKLTALMPPEELSAILISHWHFDHTSDLLPLVFRLESINRNRNPEHKVKIPVIGPEDCQSEILRIVAAAPCFALRTVRPGDELRFGEDRITIGPARHPVPAVGYRVDNKRKSFGYTGDTNTLDELSSFFRDCDLLLADALFPESDWNEDKPHLSAALAARLASDAEVKKLVLTHFNPAYSPELLVKQAVKYYSDAIPAVQGLSIRV